MIARMVDMYRPYMGDQVIDTRPFAERDSKITQIFSNKSAKNALAFTIFFIARV